ncbi:hypothetical protein AB8806_17495 (plasmid) [Ralstonia syzygii subsp. celebesensis]
MLPIAGCVTWEQFDRGMDVLIGQSVDHAISILGFPSGERTIAGKRYVQWGRSSADFVPIASPSYSTGNFNVGNKVGSYSSTTMNATYIPMSLDCTIVAELDAENRVTRTQYDGNMGGCEPFIIRLNQYRKKAGLS